MFLLKFFKELNGLVNFSLFYTFFFSILETEIIGLHLFINLLKKIPNINIFFTQYIIFYVYI